MTRQTATRVRARCLRLFRCPSFLIHGVALWTLILGLLGCASVEQRTEDQMQRVFARVATAYGYGPTDVILRGPDKCRFQLASSFVRTVCVSQLGRTLFRHHDDRLAFVVAHEFAHVYLGHALPDQERRLSRREMELAADHLAALTLPEADYNATAGLDALRIVYGRVGQAPGYPSFEDRKATIKSAVRTRKEAFK